MSGPHPDSALGAEPGAHGVRVHGFEFDGFGIQRDLCSRLIEDVSNSKRKKD